MTSPSNPKSVGHRALAALGLTGRRRKIPVMQQVTAADCGAACLAMVLAYHGRQCRLEEVRIQVGTGRDGSSALDIVHAARRYGMRARGMKVEAQELEFLVPGTVLHWGFRHFVVFERMRGDAAIVVDPAFGRRVVTMDEVCREFTGVALHLEPSDGSSPAGPNNARFAGT